jgi:hypothetical protein
MNNRGKKDIRLAVHESSNWDNKRVA